MATKLEPQWTADTAAGSATGPSLALRGWRVTNEHINENINENMSEGTDVSASEVYPKQVSITLQFSSLKILSEWQNCCKKK